jgi:hypothetical protein
MEAKTGQMKGRKRRWSRLACPTIRSGPLPGSTSGSRFLKHRQLRFQVTGDLQVTLGTYALEPAVQMAIIYLSIVFPCAVVKPRYPSLLLRSCGVVLRYVILLGRSRECAWSWVGTDISFSAGNCRPKYSLEARTTRVVHVCMFRRNINLAAKSIFSLLAALCAESKRCRLCLSDSSPFLPAGGRRLGITPL